MDFKNYLSLIKEKGYTRIGRFGVRVAAPTPIRHKCWMCFGTGKVNKKDCTNMFCLGVNE